MTMRGRMWNSDSALNFRYFLFFCCVSFGVPSSSMRWPQQHSARWPARAASFSLLAQTAPPIGSELEGWAGPCLLDRQYLNQHTLTYDLKQWDFVGAAEAILGSRLGHLHRAPIEAPEVTPPALRRAQIAARVGARVSKRERKGARDYAKRYEQTDEYRAFLGLYRRFVCEWVLPQFGNVPLLYQRKPILRVVLPGSVPPTQLHCDADYFHDSNEVNYWIPLSKVWGSNTLWSESAPGRGDYMPFEADAGEAVRFYGNRCRHYTLENTSDGTRVSFDFRVIPRHLFVPPSERGHVASLTEKMSRHALDPTKAPGGYYAFTHAEGRGYVMLDPQWSSSASSSSQRVRSESYCQ